MIRAAVLTVSDRASQGIYEDLSGPEIRQGLKREKCEIVVNDIVPDEADLIEAKLIEYCDELKVDLVLTTGGTGFGPRDVTPEATLAVIERTAPGISEYIRMRGSEITIRAILSRGISGIRGRTLIVNLPGSPKAVKESLSFVADILIHSASMLSGEGHAPEK